MTAQIGSTTLPLNTLRIDPANVRKVGRGVDPQLLASIRAHGVLNALRVRLNGTGYLVSAGGQRLMALQQLAKNGEIKNDAPVPVVIVKATDSEAKETSLAENLARTGMHPVDAFRAFSSLHTDKEKPLDVEAIALRFGADAKTVRQRLALGQLDDVILNAWLKGDLREADVQAFTLQPDKKEQVRIFTKLRKSHQCYAHGIRAEIMAGQRNVKSALQTVGVKDYEKRGGKITRDLFGDDMIVSDPALLQTMIEEYLAKIVETTKAEWAWVETARPDNEHEYGRLQIPFKATAQEKAKLKKFDQSDAEDAYEKGEALRESILERGLTPDLKKKAGVRILFENGSLTVQRGLVKPSEKRAADKTGGKSAKATKKGPSILTNALRDRLKEQRETAIKKALVAHPHGNPLASLLAGIIAAQINPGRFNAAPHDVEIKFDALVDLIAPKVVNAAMRTAFDAKGYFEGCGKAFCIAAITEAVNADEARKIANKKRGEIAKFALANVGKTAWLPKELRTKHYDGPQKKAVKAKAQRKTTSKSKAR